MKLKEKKFKNVFLGILVAVLVNMTTLLLLL